MTHDPRLTVKDIDSAIKACVADGLTGIEVALQWNHYQDLLTVKGLDASNEAKASWGYDNEGRPLKEFQGYPLHLRAGGSSVTGSRPDRSIIGRAIIIRYEP